MQKVEQIASQAQEAVGHIQDQASLRRESLFDLSGRVALVTGTPPTALQSESKLTIE